MFTRRLASFASAVPILLAVSFAGCRPMPESIRQWRSAEDLFEAEKYEQAAVACRSWLADYHDVDNPLQPNVLYKLGECYQMMRDYERARSAYRKMIELHAGSPYAEVRELIEKVVRPRLNGITPKPKEKLAPAGPGKRTVRPPG